LRFASRSLIHLHSVSSCARRFTPRFASRRSGCAFARRVGIVSSEVTSPSRPPRKLASLDASRVGIFSRNFAFFALAKMKPAYKKNVHATKFRRRDAHVNLTCPELMPKLCYHETSLKSEIKEGRTKKWLY
jgi:hypothetical protein